ncbi:hypothetical protein CHCC14820_2544 [Bacillus paralicheniformis]|nr:hypothetical protein SC10_B2orf03475 [Bacillus paralicheniformis]TWN16485.1 hypothetical protein CHCC14564_1050 [Bacillus licheniformis LMG 17339]OLG07684.1 hypothetical protein B4125_1865 [Bacillus paralicheniformis]TWJ60713.1 hypothetical protein CHCC5023_0830 [Bacillus paralicheniformis]TWK41049.1 hypothetical protein CHCC20347_4486 [Bacillus paralicheniformis]
MPDMCISGIIVRREPQRKNILLRFFVLSVIHLLIGSKRKIS